MEYRVAWSIDVDADDPIDAARLAESIYMKTEGCRTYEVFEWEPLDVGSGARLSPEHQDVDLDIEDDK